MTTTTATKSSARNLSSLFSWNKSRQVTPLNCFLEMDEASPRKPGFGVATELIQFDEENAHLSYTSLRDLLPAVSSRPGSPVKPKRPLLEGRDEKPEEEVAWGGSDRPPIKNRLVEQAARAYLLPTSPQKTPPDQFFARYWAKLTSNPGHTENHNWAPPAAQLPGHGCIHGCTHGCLSCLPTLIWVDLTRVVHALFGQLRPQSLLRDHAHASTVIMNSSAIITPALVK
jgi:hypothetical protein